MNENIIGINVANGISILIMGVAGMIILTSLRKAAAKRSGGFNPGTPGAANAAAWS